MHGTEYLFCICDIFQPSTPLIAHAVALKPEELRQKVEYVSVLLPTVLTQLRPVLCSNKQNAQTTLARSHVRRLGILFVKMNLPIESRKTRLASHMEISPDRTKLCASLRATASGGRVRAAVIISAAAARCSTTVAATNKSHAKAHRALEC